MIALISVIQRQVEAEWFALFQSLGMHLIPWLLRLHHFNFDYFQWSFLKDLDSSSVCFYRIINKNTKGKSKIKKKKKEAYLFSVLAYTEGLKCFIKQLFNELFDVLSQTKPYRLSHHLAFCSTTKSGVLSLIFVVVCFSHCQQHHKNHRNVEILHWQVTLPPVAKDRPAIPKSLLRGGYLTFSRALSAIDIPSPPSDI